MPVPAGMEADHHGVTVIASMEMAAHGRGSTPFDRPHRLLLARMQARLLTIGPTMTPEDITDLDLPRRARRDTHLQSSS